MERLPAKGYISDPKTRAKSIVFSEQGEWRAQELFERRDPAYQVAVPSHTRLRYVL